MGRCKGTLVGSLCLASLALFGQSLDSQTTAWLAAVRASGNQNVPSALTKATDVKALLTVCRPHFDDTLSVVRTAVYGLVGRAALRSSILSDRQSVTQALIDQKSDKENTDVISELLFKFERADFTPQARDSLASWVRLNPPRVDQLVRLSGALGVGQLEGQLRELSGPSTRSQKVRWSALLALARMGDESALNEVMRRVKRFPVSDDVVYELFPDLAYTRQRVAVDYLFDAILSEEKNCATADAGDETPILCAFRTMEIVAPVVENFPVKLSTSGDLESKDYEKALMTVRSWIQKNRASYSVDTSRLK